MQQGSIDSLQEGLVANFACCVSVSAAGMRETALTYLTLVPIAGGVVIASGGEPLFNLFGFTACIIATCCRALKSVVQVGLRLQPLPTMVMAMEQQHIALGSDCQPRSLAAAFVLHSWPCHAWLQAEWVPLLWLTHITVLYYLCRKST